MPPDPSQIFLDVVLSKAIDEKWLGKPHEAFKHLPNSSKGDAGEEFLKRYLQVLGFTVEKLNRLGDWDLKINEKRCEVKLASEDITGAFQFNHIRYDTKYDYLICLGVTPTKLVFDIWSKAEVATEKAGTLVTMGKGQNSSFKLTKKVGSLKPIRQIKTVLRSLFRS